MLQIQVPEKDFITAPYLKTEIYTNIRVTEERTKLRHPEKKLRVSFNLLMEGYDTYTGETPETGLIAHAQTGAVTIDKMGVMKISRIRDVKQAPLKVKGWFGRTKLVPQPNRLEIEMKWFLPNKAIDKFYKNGYTDANFEINLGQSLPKVFHEKINFRILFKERVFIRYFNDIIECEIPYN